MKIEIASIYNLRTVYYVMGWLILLSAILFFLFGEFWWGIVTTMLGLLIGNYKREPKKIKLPMEEDKMPLENNKVLMKKGSDNELRRQYESHIEFLKAFPESAPKLSEKLILEVKRQIQNSEEFYPITDNPSAEIAVIKLIHEQGDVGVMLAVAPKVDDSKALWYIRVFSDY